MSEFDLATFVVIVSLWLATIWLAYRIGLQSVRDEHAEGLPTAVPVRQLHQGERGKLPVDLSQADAHRNRYG
jgi:hypothetical protein